MKFFKIIKHKHNRQPIFVLSVILIFTSLWAFGDVGESLLPTFCSSEDFLGKPLCAWKSWDKWITVLTFAVAIFIGWQGYVRRWENSLPNKITVHFMFDGNCIMSCYRLYLSAESETRTWGQQIGKQMNDNKFLDFKPDIEQAPMKVVSNRFKHYQMTFFLEKEPEIFKAEELKGKYLTWVLQDGDFLRKTHNRVSSPLSLEQASDEGETLPKPSQPDDNHDKKEQNDSKKPKKMLFYYSED